MAIKERAAAHAAALVSFDMGVIGDVILAIAMVAAAAGAVAEFQLRIGHIRPAADRAFVVVVRSGRRGSSHLVPF